LDGSTIRLEDYEGQLIALNFWATWCPPCVQELPLLDEAQERHADAGLAVIAMNAGQTRKHVTAFLQNRDLEDLPVAMDPGREVYDAYGIVGLPTTVWIDRQGNVHAVEIGGLTQEVIDRYVAEMLEAEESG
jgi:thiol-disulfide isomerase/thioredoxin